jgi:hypothetical protein
MTTAATGDDASVNKNAADISPSDKQSRKCGAPKNNSNALRHGLHSVRPGAGISAYAREQINKFRLAIERTVAEANCGSIGPLGAALIHSATEAARVAAANRELLSKLGDDVKPELRLQIDAAYLAALDKRDRKLSELGLAVADLPGGSGQAKADPFASLTFEPLPAGPSPVSPPPTESLGRAPE